MGPWHSVSVAWYLGASGSLEVVGSGEREGTGFSVLRISHLLAIGKLKKKKEKKNRNRIHRWFCAGFFSFCSFEWFLFPIFLFLFFCFFFFKENTVKTLERGREKTDKVGICPGHPPASHLLLRSPWPQGSESVPLQHTVCSAAQSHPTVTPWTAACQAPPSMGILQARTLEWVAIPSSRIYPTQGLNPRSPTLQADS